MPESYMPDQMDWVEPDLTPGGVTFFSMDECPSGLGKGTKLDDTGLQTMRPYRADLIDAGAMLALAKVMHDGLATHEPDGWRKLPVASHLGRALVHIWAHLMGDRSNDHLEHGLARLMMALAVHQAEKEED